MITRGLLIGGMWLVVGASGCTPDDEPDDEDDRNAALHVMVDAQGATGVEAAELVIADCVDDDVVFSETLDLDTWSHEQMTPSYVDDDAHLFLEAYRDVEPGCYDVEVRLLDTDGEPVETCTTAVGRGLEVERGETAEALLYSRCDDGEGPRVEMLHFEPGTRTECGAEVDVCATVDGEGSEIAFNWSYDGQAHPSEPPRAGETSRDGRHVVQCARWETDRQGEMVGHLEAFPARAETTDGGQTVVMYDTHTVQFGLYVECPEHAETERETRRLSVEH